MPTALRAKGFRFFFVSHDRTEPPYVHIERGGANAKVWLEGVIVARNDGFAAHELGDMIRTIRSQRAELLEAWNGHFGPE